MVKSAVHIPYFSVFWLTCWCAVDAAPTEVPLDRLDSSAVAGQEASIYVFGGNGPDSDDAYEYDSDSESAIAETFSHPFQAGSANPTGSLLGMVYNQAIAGSGKQTSAASVRYYFVRDDGVGAYALMYSGFGHGSTAEATWEIPQIQSGDTWVEGKIYIQSVGSSSTPPPGYFYFNIGTSGEVTVGDTQLYFSAVDGEIQVVGTLMDLDGPHQINQVFDEPTVELTSRQYISPGEEFETFASEVTYPYFDTFHDVDSPVSDEIYSEDAAYSTIKAYVGDPD